MQSLKIDELNSHEMALISILRNFEFLKKYGFHVNSIVFGGIDFPSISYLNYKNKIQVHIIGNESYEYLIQIQRKSYSIFKRNSSIFEISDYYCFFDCSLLKGKNYTLKSQSDFIQKFLIPIINGDIWIDELIKIKKIKNIFK